MEQVTTLQVVLAILGSSLLTTAFTEIFRYLISEKKTKAILLLGAVENLVDKILRQGYRTQMQTLRLQEAQTQYEKYGNGYAKSIVADAMALPMRHDNAA